MFGALEKCEPDAFDPFVAAMQQTWPNPIPFVSVCVRL